ncbi:MAG: DUF58 domain-containing protein [Polyangiaceae bacterium]|nr:DUF58 domain-containing protein [Polyangiaceae bacterium]
MGALDWSRLTGLRLRARAVADGLVLGAHASRRRGGGVEFSGHRAYVPGDDLRLIDRRVMARHDRPFVRELETDTDRALWLVVDASASMGFRGERSRVTKLEYASVVAAALARVATATGDAVGLTVLGSPASITRPARGAVGFARVTATLEAARAAGDLSRDLAALDRALFPVAERARAGSVVVLLSDLVDVHEALMRRFLALATRRRVALAVRVLDREEASFPFSDPLRLVAVEGDYAVETNPDAVRAGYLAAIAETRERWQRGLVDRGGRFVDAATDGDPVEIVRAVLAAAAGGRSS